MTQQGTRGPEPRSSEKESPKAADKSAKEEEVPAEESGYGTGNPAIVPEPEEEDSEEDTK